MGEENFHANMQYNDSMGTAAADNHDRRSLSRYLQQQGFINDGELLVGVEMSSGEVHGDTQDRPVDVVALIARVPGFDDLQATLRSGAPLHVRKIRLEMTLSEFFGFFKRFQVSVSNKGVIDGRDIVVDE